MRTKGPEEYGILDKRAAVFFSAVVGILNALAVFGFLTLEEATYYASALAGAIVLLTTLGAGKLIEKYVYSRKTAEKLASGNGICYCRRNYTNYCDAGKGCERV